MGYYSPRFGFVWVRDNCPNCKRGMDNWYERADIMTDADPGYHRDPSKMTHHYDLDLVWCTGSETRTVCPLGRVDHMKDTKYMLCDTFPQFPKSHWECWAPYMRGHKERSGLWLRVHHTADFEWRHWDTWRLWRPWREWLDIDTYEQAVEYAKGLKMEGEE